MSEQTTKQTYNVTMIDSSVFSPMDGTDVWSVDGFPTLELAREFARRWVRSCVEEARERENDPSAWRMYGETALTEGYNAGDDAEFFAANPATPEEIDYQAIKRLAGLDTP